MKNRLPDCCGKINLVYYGVTTRFFTAPEGKKLELWKPHCILAPLGDQKKTVMDLLSAFLLKNNLKQQLT